MSMQWHSILLFLVKRCVFNARRGASHKPSAAVSAPLSERPRTSAYRGMICRLGWVASCRRCCLPSEHTPDRDALGASLTRMSGNGTVPGPLIPNTNYGTHGWRVEEGKGKQHVTSGRASSSYGRRAQVGDLTVGERRCALDLWPSSPRSVRCSLDTSPTACLSSSNSEEMTQPEDHTVMTAMGA